MRTRLFVIVVLACLLVAGMVQAQGGSISTNVVTNGGGNGAFFNLTAHSRPIYITGFETNLVGTANVRVYYTPGGYEGVETNAGAWTLLGSQTLTGGTGFHQNLYRLNVGGLTIPAGETYGILIYSGYTGDYPPTVATRYRIDASGAFSNGDITLTAGASCWFLPGHNEPFKNYIANRVWHGTVFYSEPTSGGEGQIATFMDGRINRYDMAAPFAVYAHQDATGQPGLIFYDAYTHSRALLAVTAAQIAAVPEFPAVNTLIAASADGRVALYRLTDGQFQAMGPMRDSSKVYGLIFPAIGAGVEYRTFEEG